MCSIQGLGIQVFLVVTVASQMLLPPTTASLPPTTVSKFPRGACEYCTVKKEIKVVAGNMFYYQSRFLRFSFRFVLYLRRKQVL